MVSGLGEVQSPPPYAVIFRTHFWDDFTTRQFERVRRRVKSGDIYVLVDETRGRVEGIPCDAVFRLTDTEILQAGYPAAGEGSMQWYSGDIPLYLFAAKYTGYEYYVQLEYDAIINADLDEIITRLSKVGTDVVAESEEVPDDSWAWRSTCESFYRRPEITHLLVCISMYSAKALSLLSSARLAQAARYKSEIGLQWPMCEGFIGTESRQQGLKVTQLAELGNVEYYRWWPPYSERHALGFSQSSFVHPVLEPRRLVPSILRPDFYPGISRLLSPTSTIHQQLRTLGTTEYLRAMLSKPFRQSLSLAIRRKLKRA